MKKKKQKHTRTKSDYRDVGMVVDTKDFAATIVAGKTHNELKIASPMWYGHQLNKFKVGERVSIYISSRRPKRTLQQNRYYFGAYLPLIAKETGEHDIERLHRFFAGKFLTSEIVKVFGKPVRLVKSSTELTKAEFSEYIMNIEAETGIMPPPTQNYFDPAPLITDEIPQHKTRLQRKAG